MADYYAIFYDYLENNHVDFAIVSNWDGLMGNDVDMVLSSKDFERIDQLIFGFCKKEHFRIFARIQHELKAIRYVLVSMQKDGLIFLHPDVSAGYYVNNRCYIKDKDFLISKNGIQPAFPILFIYYLIKKIEKERMNEIQFNYLSNLLMKGAEISSKKMKSLFSDEHVQLIKQAFRENEKRYIIENMKTLKKEIRRKRPLSFVTLIRYLKVVFNRIIQPTGYWIVFLGPDGSGKSTVIRNLKKDFNDLFREILLFHYRPTDETFDSDNRVEHPREKKNRNWFISMMKPPYLLMIYHWGYLTKIWLCKIRSSLILFDRYYHDMLIDPERYRFGGSRMWATLTGKMIPEPDLWIFLNADPQEVCSRKNELTLETVQILNNKYMEFIDSRNNSEIIDASLPLSDVTRSVKEIIISRLDEREKNRRSNDSSK